MHRHRLNKLLALTTILFAAAHPALAGDDDEKSASTLKGSVDETAPLEPTKAAPGIAPIEPLVAPVVAPKLKKPLQGTVQQEGKRKPLDANAAEDDESLNAIQPFTDQIPKKVLKGNAAQDADALAKQDPDADDQELQVAWDKWRNRFLGAVQGNMQNELNDPADAQLRWDPENQVLLAKFPLGISAWFTCQVTSDRHIASYKLLRSSGYPNYDKTVQNCVRSLEGSEILKFPSRSRRVQVTQMAGIKTSDTGGGTPNFKFGDVERYRLGQ